MGNFIPTLDGKSADQVIAEILAANTVKCVAVKRKRRWFEWFRRGYAVEYIFVIQAVA